MRRFPRWSLVGRTLALKHPRIKSFRGASSSGFAGLHAAGQAGSAHLSELGRTAANCNLNCNLAILRTVHRGTARACQAPDHRSAARDGSAPWRRRARTPVSYCIGCLWWPRVGCGSCRAPPIAPVDPHSLGRNQAGAPSAGALALCAIHARYSTASSSLSTATGVA